MIPARRLRRPQRGALLIALLAILVLASSWFIVSRLDAISGDYTVARRSHNAAVLLAAKQALIGYVAMKAADLSEDNPGRLPCPEPAVWTGLADRQGIAAPNTLVTPPAATCSTLGRLPWRTIGVDQLRDADNEPLWYAVGPTWRLTNSSSSLLINSNTRDDLTVDGTANAAVAVIVAPGAAMTGQGRSAPAPGIDPVNYLECYNATSTPPVFSTPGCTSNDQVIKITVADLLPAIEAAIARRIELQIVPVLSTVYADVKWGTSTTNPAFAFPAPFGDPTTSGYLGQTGCSLTRWDLCQGLVPFNYHSATCGGDARCLPDVTNWGGLTQVRIGGTASTSLDDGCLIQTVTPPLPATPYEESWCRGRYFGGTLDISLTDPAAAITRSLRTFTTSEHAVRADSLISYDGKTWVASPWTVTATPSRSLASNGSASFVAKASFPNTAPYWGAYRIYSRRPAISDHAILSSTDPTTGWFVRNEWYRLLYYAIAPGHAPGPGTLSCSDSGTITCLQITNLTDPTKQRAILVLAGRALTTLGQRREDTASRSSLANYLDSVENHNLNSIFVQSTVGSSFNDRFISLGKNP